MNKQSLVIIVSAAVIMVFAGLALISGNSTNSNNVNNSDVSSNNFTRAQLAQHNTPNDCYTSYKGVVYNLTSFVSRHRGGTEILAVCGKAADSFSASHPGGSFESSEVQRILVNLEIGKLVD